MASVATGDQQSLCVSESPLRANDYTANEWPKHQDVIWPIVTLSSIGKPFKHLKLKTSTQSSNRTRCRAESRSSWCSDWLLFPFPCCTSGEPWVFSCEDCCSTVLWDCFTGNVHTLLASRWDWCLLIKKLISQICCQTLTCVFCSSFWSTGKFSSWFLTRACALCEPYLQRFFPVLPLRKP